MDSDLEGTQPRSPKLADEARKLAKLYVEAGKYTLAEKLTMLLSALLVCVVAVLMSLGVLIYVSLCLVHMLAAVMAIEWAYLIMAAIMVVLSALLWLLREYIVYNPVARFVSRLIIESPDK